MLLWYCPKELGVQEFRLLNSDEHTTYLQRKQLDPGLYRPDICQQVLLPAYAYAKWRSETAAYVKPVRHITILYRRTRVTLS